MEAVPFGLPFTFFLDGITIFAISANNYTTVNVCLPLQRWAL